MPHNITAAKRLSKLLENKPGMELTKMFGGHGFLYRGHMCAGIFKEFLIIRVGPDKLEELFEKYSLLKEMDITGRPMRGWAMIEAASCNDEAFSKLVSACVAFVKTLPEKKPAMR